MYKTNVFNRRTVLQVEWFIVYFLTFNNIVQVFVTNKRGTFGKRHAYIGMCKTDLFETGHEFEIKPFIITHCGSIS